MFLWQCILCGILFFVYVRTDLVEVDYRLKLLVRSSIYGADEACSKLGGRCQDDSGRCDGSYVTGKCSGPNTRRCCTTKQIISDTGFCENVKIISRDSWGARRSKKITKMKVPVSRTFIHHTESQGCSNTTRCSYLLRNIQDYHMKKKGWDDIGYNFLIGGDGHVYEARGWHRVGAHTFGYNNRSIAVSFIGNFMARSPVPGALEAAKKLIECATKHHIITPDYILLGHRQVGNTTCPGDTLYRIIQTWPHYKKI